MDLKFTEHVWNTISLLYMRKKKKKPNKTKQNTGEILKLGTFLAKKSVLAYISLKLDIFRSDMSYYVIVTSYVDRFSWFWYQ